MFNVDKLFKEKEKSAVFIVAEIGINHNGKKEDAFHLIDLAKSSGADAVKFQIFQTKYFYHPSLKDAVDIFQTYEFSFDIWDEIFDYAVKKDIFFFATPLDIYSLDWILKKQISLIKFASSDLTTYPFFDRLKGCSNHLIISTGMSLLSEIKKIDQDIKDLSHVFLYAVSSYPTLPEEVQLSFLDSIKQNISPFYGFSDHTLDNYISFAAVTKGAKIIERHFTDDRKKVGGDHSISLEPHMFSDLVKGIRSIEKALLSSKRVLSTQEKQIKNLSRRDLYALVPISKGEKFTKEKLIALRPGTGISKKQYETLLKNVASHAYQKYEKIDIEND